MSAAVPMGNRAPSGANTVGVIPRLEVPPPSIRVLAFVDVETTGLDPARHEILEVAVVRVDASSLEVLSEYTTLVAPTRLEDADPQALAICGFTRAGWSRAIPAAEALANVARHLDGALVAGHNVGFDWSFLEAGFRRAGLALPRVDYHRLDTASLAWPLHVAGHIPSVSLDEVAAFLGLERAKPHRALADARCSLAVAERLSAAMLFGERLLELEDDEHEIVQELLERLEAGRRQYGPWHVDDGRDYPTEAYEEVLDALHYVAAELVRRRRQAEPCKRGRRVYVCHPYSDDPPQNCACIRRHCRALAMAGLVPIAPQLYLPEFIDEESERELALSLCLELVTTCDEVRIFGAAITPGMHREIQFAREHGVPVYFAEDAP